MNRRKSLIAALSLPALFAWAEEPHAVPTELAERIGDLAAALADGDAAGFLHQFDKRMPGYQDLGGKVRALVEIAEVTSSVKPLSEEVHGLRHVIQADWTLQITIRGRPPGSAQTAGREYRPGHTEQRSRTVTLTLVKQGRHWRFVDFRPLSLFDPPTLQ